MVFLSSVRAVALLALLWPADATAQAAEACGTADTLLMYCTVNDGQKQVAVCQFQDMVSYAFGAQFSDPELRLVSNVADIAYVPFSWASNTIFESVTFHNGNTTYEVHAAAPRGADGGTAEGGIVVTRPDQSQVSLSCDPGSVWPSDPLDGLGQLTAVIRGDREIGLRRCIDNAEDPASCLGSVRAIDFQQARCNDEEQITDCWAMEQRAWEAALAAVFEVALTKVKTLQGEAFAQQLRAAQDGWDRNRELDCELAHTLPLAGDGGTAFCHAQYAAQRITFLRQVVSGAEFDG